MKKSVLSACAVMLAAFVLFLAVSCDAVGDDPFFHSVTVMVDDSVIVSEIIYHDNEYTLPGEQKKGGYIFESWTDGKTDYKAGETVRILEDITFRVKWLDGYVISYDANGGKGESVTDTVRTGSYGTLRSGDTFSKDGYVIDGWYTSPDAEGDFYEAEARITPESNLRLYAHWVDSRLSYVLDETTGTYSVKASGPLSSSPDIPSVYKGKKVASLADEAFKDSTFSSITIPSTIKEIGSRVFDGCTNLKTVALPDSVESIASDAFAGSSLATISVGKDEDEFVSGAPWGASSAVMKWKQYAVTFVSGGADGTRAPQFFTKGTAFTLEGASDSEGNGFTKSGCVFDCWADNADNPTNYYISGESVTFDAAVTLYALWVDDSLEFTADDEATPTEYSVTVSDGKKTTVTAVTIPETYHGKPVTAVKNFSGCTKLGSVTIKGENVTIDEGAFKDIDTLSSVFLASGTKIKADAFNGCESLESISLAGVTEIGDRAFANSGLTSVTVPDTVTALGAGVFYNCVDLAGAEIECSPSELKSYTDVTVTPSDVCGFFENCSSLETFVIPGTVTKIGDEAFRNSGLESITFPSGTSLTEIGREAFSGTSLTSVSIPEGVTKTGDGAFSLCSELKKVEIPSSMTEIGKEMFSDCSALETVTFKETSKVSVIGEKAFSGCESLNNVALPKSTDTIGTRAFENCTSLNNLTIDSEATIEEIKDYVFSGCTALKSIALPDETKKINSIAFADSAITSISVGKDMEEFAAKDDYPWGAASGSVRWKQYEITFNANGADGNKANQAFSKDSAVSFNDSTGFTKTGYRFDHWNSKNDGSGTIYEAGSSYTLTGSITVYAVWVDENIEFVYDSTAGTYSVKVRDERKTEAQSVTIPSSYRGKSVTAVQNNGFEGCTGLQSVSLPESVKKIGDSAFSGCTSLSSINLDNVETIGLKTFEGCSALKSVSLTGAVSIGDMAFASSGLESVTVPSTVITLGGGVFYGCTALSSVTLSNNPTELKSYTSGSDTYGFFEGCSRLAAISLPSNLTSIDKEAFRNCTSLSSISIPSSVTTIKDNAFEGTSALSTVTYEGTSSLSSIGKEVFKGSGLTSFSVPESVTAIDSNAFKDSSLTKISFAVDDASSSINGYPWGAKNSTIEWKQYAVSFYDGTAEITELRQTGAKNSTITLGSYSKDGYFFDAWNTSSDGSGTYYEVNGTYNVTGEATLYAQWKDIDAVFEYDSTTQTYTITSSGSGATGAITIPSTYRGKNVVAIADNAFSGKTGITGVTIPATVKTIGGSAFSGCTALKTLTFSGTACLTSIGKEAFRNTALTSVTIPSSVTSIGDGAFAESSLTSIEIPDTVTSLGGGMFYNCSSLTTVTLPTNTSVTSLSSYDFGGTTGEKGFFEGCSKLTSVTTPDNITDIGDYAFKDCTELTGVTYSSAVTAIGKEAFYGCSKLSTATVPEKVTAINEKTFSGCSSLSSVSIGSGIQTIASDAFENCQNLLLISIDKTTSEITSMAGEENRWGAGESCAVCGNTEEVYVAALVDDTYADSKTVTMKVWKEEEDGTKSYKVGTESQGVTVAFNSVGSETGGFYTIKVPSGDFNRVEIKTSKQTHEYTIDLASNPNQDVLLTLAYSSTSSKIMYEVQYRAKGTFQKYYDESKVTNVDTYTYVTAIIVDETLRAKTSTAKMWITSTESGTIKYHLGTSSGITVTCKTETFTVKVPTSTFTNIKVTAGGYTWTCTVDLASNPGKDIMWMLQSPNIIKYVEKDYFAGYAGTVTY